MSIYLKRIKEIPLVVMILVRLHMKTKLISYKINKDYFLYFLLAVSLLGSQV